MKWLDKIVQWVLLCCMFGLGAYIILRGVTIAGDNGVFEHSPVLSAWYRKIEDWTTGKVVPVISYVEKEPVEEMLLMERLYPLSGYISSRKQQERALESQSEYELIVRAEAQAEENKNPRDSGQLPIPADQPEDEEALYDFNYLLYHYFSMDMTTTIDRERLDGKKLLAMDMTMQKKEEPQILIYHTHSQEGFVDTVEGDDTTTIVGVGDYLAKLLCENYGYRVIHERGVFDLVDGVLDRNLAYDLSLQKVEEWLQKYPSIEVVIDLHRDGVDGTKFVTEYQGKPAAKLMYIVGMSRTAGYFLSSESVCGGKSGLCPPDAAGCRQTLPGSYEKYLSHGISFQYACEAENPSPGSGNPA